MKRSSGVQDIRTPQRAGALPSSFSLDRINRGYALVRAVSVEAVHGWRCPESCNESTKDTADTHGSKNICVEAFLAGGAERCTAADTVHELSRQLQNQRQVEFQSKR